ncbi:MAG TPA: DUF6600 domain-containing protein [Blastocatellia bacterium]
MRIRFPFMLCILALLLPLAAPMMAPGQSLDQDQAAQTAQAAQTNQQQAVDQTQSAQTGQLQLNTPETDSDDSQNPPRVARVFSIQGDVSFERSGDSDWYDAAINLPLLAGDQIYAGPDSQAVIQLSRTIFIHLSEKTDLAISQLDDSTGEFEVPAGSVVMEITGLKSAFDLFEVDTPVSSVLVNADGMYRVDVSEDGSTVAMVRGGAADVASADGELAIGDGRMARVGAAGSGQLESANLDPNDNWGLGNSDSSPSAMADAGPPNTPQDDPNRELVPAPDYVNTYENTYDGLYGADELSYYGTWTYYPTYGNIWLPRVGPGWTPYRLGRWIWITAVGWTWVPAESWGWAPSHHGRWTYIANFGWAWVPGFGPGRQPFVTGAGFYAWRPASVTFFTYQGSGRGLVGWIPLGPSDKPAKGTSTSSARASLLPSNPASAKGISVMAVAAFQGSSMGSPAAPGPELRIPIVVRSRRQPVKRPLVVAGLQNVHASKAALSPIAPEAIKSPVIVRPPVAVISRPVVTRHMPAKLAASPVGATREHKLIKPLPTPLMSNARAGSAEGGTRVTAKRTFGRTTGRSRTGPTYAARDRLGPVGGVTEPPAQAEARRREADAEKTGNGGNGGPVAGSNNSGGAREAHRAVEGNGAAESRPAPAHAAAPVHYAPAPPPSSGGDGGRKH